MKQLMRDLSMGVCMLIATQLCKSSWPYILAKDRVYRTALIAWSIYMFCKFLIPTYQIQTETIVRFMNVERLYITWAFNLVLFLYGLFDFLRWGVVVH